MSQISDPSSKQESAYTAYLERLVFLLSKRIVWNMKQGLVVQLAKNNFQ